jgi:hypothetical protein
MLADEAQIVSKSAVHQHEGGGGQKSAAWLGAKMLRANCKKF